ncbi:MAG: Stp1/IreP family PP2C-type Ser/Thr phosphatase [Acidimicrobiales bacterium]
MTELRAGAATDIGLVRASNQDQLLVAHPLFAVADGMGGHAAGEVASRIAVDSLAASFAELAAPSPDQLGAAAQAANRAVWDHAQSAAELRGMGTTLVALALVADGGQPKLGVVNVGDSRAYRLRDGELAQLTNDHSLVQELVDEGQLGAEEAAHHPQRHVLTRALGVDPDVAVDLTAVTPVPGDRFLLCSDGLVREVDDNQVAAVLRRLADPDDAARELVAQAKAHGGSDNVTVVVVDVVAGQPGGPAAPPAAAEPTAVVKGAPPAGPARRPPPRRRPRAPGGAAGPLNQVVTVRVLAFSILVVGLLAIAGAGVGLYARGSYYVGLSGRRLTIFQGRPGGMLWLRPTVAQRTDVTTAGVLAYHLGALRAGQPEGSLDAARQYVQSLQAEYSRDQAPNLSLPPSVSLPPSLSLPPSVSLPNLSVPPTTSPSSTSTSSTTSSATPPAT